MAYTDGLFMVRSICTAEGGGSTGVIQIMGGGSAGTPTFGEEYVFPCAATIYEFGLIVNVTLGTQATAAPVCSLLVATAAATGASGTAIATITPAAAAAAGTRVISTDTSFPYRVPAGGCIAFSRTTLGNADTGDYIAYVICRLDGRGVAESTTASPVSQKAT